MSANEHLSAAGSAGDRYRAWRALLIRRREARRWTQGELAERSGMDRSLVWRLERGVKSPTLLSVEKLAAGLGLDPRERDRFYLAAGYAMANPLSALAGHDGWLLHEVYELLGDGRLDERAGRALRDGLAMLVEEARACPKPSLGGERAGEGRTA